MKSVEILRGHNRTGVGTVIFSMESEEFRNVEESRESNSQPRGWPNFPRSFSGMFVSAHLLSMLVDRLVGLVVQASASRAEDSGFESRLRRDFFRVESYQ